MLKKRRQQDTPSVSHFSILHVHQRRSVHPTHIFHEKRSSCCGGWVGGEVEGEEVPCTAAGLQN